MVTQFGALGETLKQRELLAHLTHRDYGLGLTGSSLKPLVLVRVGWDTHRNKLHPTSPRSFPVSMTRCLQLAIGAAALPPCDDSQSRLPVRSFPHCPCPLSLSRTSHHSSVSPKEEGRNGNCGAPDTSTPLNPRAYSSNPHILGSESACF